MIGADIDRPIRTIADIEALERIPLDERITNWDINHWIRRGFRVAPEKPAILYLEDADLDREADAITYRALADRVARTAALFRALGVGKGDRVVYLLPTLPQSYVVQLASLAVGVACPFNWMLRPAQLVELIRAADAKLVKDVIIRGGHNIDPAVIEEALLLHPAVTLAAAVSKPDAYAGELPIAYVQLAEGARADEDELLAFVRARITERAATPDEIVIGEIPLTDVRKPDKVKLRQDVARRVFAAELTPVVEARVEVGADARHGTLVTITVAADENARAATERRIADLMRAYAVAYELRWS